MRCDLFIYRYSITSEYTSCMLFVIAAPLSCLQRWCSHKLSGTTYKAMEWCWQLLLLCQCEAGSGLEVLHRILHCVDVNVDQLPCRRRDDGAAALVLHVRQEQPRLLCRWEQGHTGKKKKSCRTQSVALQLGAETPVIWRVYLPWLVAGVGELHGSGVGRDDAGRVVDEAGELEVGQKR